MSKEKNNEFIQKEKFELPEEDLNDVVGGYSTPDDKQDKTKEQESVAKPLFI